MCKIEPRVQLLSNNLMLSKFFSIIRGDRVNRRLHIRQQSHDSLPDGRGSSSFHLCNQGVHRLALAQGDQRLSMAFADDGVHFPVTDACLPVHNGGTLINADLIHQNPTTLITTITLLSFLLATQVPVQLTAVCLVLVYVVIYPFMTQSDTFSFMQPVTDLLRTSFVPQPDLYSLPQGRGESLLLAGFSTRLPEQLSLAGSIASQATVASEFTANSRFMHAYQGGYVRLCMSCFHQGVNLVTLMLGKLCVVSHLCLSFLLERKVRMLPQLAVRAT